MRKKGNARALSRFIQFGCAVRARSSELANEPDHYAEDLERAFGPNRRIGLVLGLEDKLTGLDIEAFQGELIVDDGHDDFTLLRRGALLDDDEIAVENAGVLHRIALDPNQDRRRWTLDQVVVD